MEKEPVAQRIEHDALPLYDAQVDRLCRGVGKRAERRGGAREVRGVDCKGERVPDRLDHARGHGVERGEGVEEDLVACAVRRVSGSLSFSGRGRGGPQRMRARAMLGARTSWSMGLDRGRSCRERRV